MPAGKMHLSFKNIKMSREDAHLRIKEIWCIERCKRNNGRFIYSSRKY